MPVEIKQMRSVNDIHTKCMSLSYVCKIAGIMAYCLFVSLSVASAQSGKSPDKIDRPNHSRFNIGIKAGFNASMFLVSDFKIKDVTIDEIQNNYKLGYFEMCIRDSNPVSLQSPKQCT